MSELTGKMTHPDSQDLAEFRAGLVTGRRGARISAHLAVCERCDDLCDQLAEISVLLAAVPAPGLPDPVARRLDRVLAAESARRDQAERIVGDSSRDRAPSPQPRKPWDFRLVALRVLAPAAAVAVLAVGGYGLSRIGGGPAPQPASGSAASSTAAAPAAQAGAVGPASAARSRPGAVQEIEGPNSLQVVTSRTNYLRGTLRQQLAHEMAMHARNAAGPPGFASTSMKGCVLRLTKGISPGTLLLVETARFQDRPANVIVAASGHRDAAWVTTPACSGGSHYVLDTTTLAGTSAS